MIPYLIVALAGVLAGVALVALPIVRRGEWRCLDPDGQRCASTCIAATRRGWTDRRDVRWAARFRCARCKMPWIRTWVIRLLPAAVLRGMGETIRAERDA